MQAGVGGANFMRALLIAGSGLSALCAPGMALAEDADAAGTSDAGAVGNEIVVTATKREQTLQDTPVAVSVTTAETIERGQIRDLRDLQTVVPSLSVGQRQAVGSTNFFIRGFGNGANNAGIEPSVGVFVDGVYRSKTVSQITDLPDVERIEVLRGPQSTLFGKNASAGVISITTQAPQFDFGGSVEATYGNYNQVILKGLVTGPLNDSAAVSFAAGMNKRDGFFRDLGTGDRTNNRDRWFARGQFLLEGDHGFRARVIADYDSIDENCCAVVNLQDGLATAAVRALGGQANAPADRFSGVVYNNYNSTNAIKNYGASAQIDYDIGPFTLTSITAFRQTDAVTYQDSDFTSADLIYPNFQDLDVGTFTQEVRLAGKIGDRLNVLLGAFYISEDIDQSNKLIYGSQFRDYANILVQGLSSCAFSLFGPAVAPCPSTATPVSLETTFGALDGDPAFYSGRFFTPGQGFNEAYTLESNAISIFGQVDFELADGLILTLGGNYTDDRKTFTADARSSDFFSSLDLDAPQYAPLRRSALLQGAVAQGVGTALSLGRAATAAEVTAFATNPATSAAFATIQTQAGAYATANQNNPLANPLAQLRVLQYMPPFLPVPNAVEDGKTNDSDFSYTVRLAYDATPSLNLYASYATGFKASSINLSRDSRPAAIDRDAIIAAGLGLNNLTYGSRFAGPEESRVMEAGAKFSRGGISANLAVFDQEIKGFQSNIFTGGGFVLLNAGKQSTFGVEFEGQARVLDALTLNLGVTYLDPVYDSFEISAVGDLSGMRPASIPSWTVLVGAQYEAQVGNGRLVPRVSYLWQDRVQLIEGLPGFLVRNPDGTIANADAALAAAAQFTREVNDLTASLGYELDNGLSFTLWGRNLLDSRDVGVVFDTPAQPRGISGYPNDPRTYGATVRFKW
ncbi:MAG: TonB-dependent receptor [Altererythrobacter sp. 66-12]|nr:MAG: TonB-dependent receptor [Altererythrobacter sp. 66-12]